MVKSTGEFKTGFAQAKFNMTVQMEVLAQKVLELGRMIREMIVLCKF